MSKELIEKIINSKKVKYSVMEDIISPYINFKDHKMKNMNVFIDMEAITSQLYNDNIIDSFRHVNNEDRLVISAEIVNVIAHYRHFFASRKSMYTRFYLFHSNTPSTYHTDINNEFREPYYYRRSKENHKFEVMNNVMNYTMGIVRKIVDYIPNAFIINMGRQEPTLLPHYVINESGLVTDEDYNMIISNNKTFRQDLKYNDHTFIMELRGDKSKIVSKENLLDVMLSSSKKVPSDFPNLNYEVIDKVNVLLAHKPFNIKSVKGFAEVKSLAFFNDNSQEDYFELFDDSEEIKTRYKLLNHEYIVSNQYNEIDKRIKSQLVEYDNPSEVKKLNDDVFSDNPLLLEYLYEGEV